MKHHSSHPRPPVLQTHGKCHHSAATGQTVTDNKSICTKRALWYVHVELMVYITVLWHVKSIFAILLHLIRNVLYVQYRLPYKTIRNFISWLDKLTCQYLFTSTNRHPCHSNIPDHLQYKPSSVGLLLMLLWLQVTINTGNTLPSSTYHCATGA